MSITVGVYIGKKDRIIRYWYETLPRGQFPVLVKFCILSYLKGALFPLDAVCEVSSFREQLATMPTLHPTQRNVTFTEDDGPVYDWVTRLEPGYRSEEIKNVLQRTINHTLMAPPRSAFRSPGRPVPLYMGQAPAPGLERRGDSLAPGWTGTVWWEDASEESITPAGSAEDPYGSWEELLMSNRGRSMGNGKGT